MLASCAKTTVVYNEAPQEIAFKQITNVMTKAEEPPVAYTNVLGDKSYNQMGVFAHKTLDKTVYFGNTCFQPSEVSSDVYEWVANPKKYWPLNEELDFAVYAPYVADPQEGDPTVVRQYATTPNAVNTLRITINNSTLNSQIDWLYGISVKTASKSNNVNNVELRHALAKITVNVISDLANLTVTSLGVLETKQTGTLTVNYANECDNFTNGDTRLSFDVEDEETSDMTLFTSFTANSAGASQSGSCYVIPSDQTSIKLNYRLPETSQELTYTHDLSDNEAKWIGGKHYTYTINIAANEIKFNPSVTDWDTTDTDTTLTDVSPSNSNPVVQN